MSDQNSQFFAILTNVGAAKLANATALGVPWRITQMGVGDGHGTLPIPSAAQTSLLGEWRRAPLNQLKPDPKNAAVIIAEQIIPETVGGFWIREIALYDVDGDMVAVANCPPSYKPLVNQGSGRTQVVRINLVVSNSSLIELKIDPSVVLATRAYVDDSIGGAVVQATEMKAGIAKVATQPLADAGVDDKTFLTPKKLFAAIFKAIGFTPVQQGGGAGHLDNKIRIGFDGSRIKVAVDDTDMGNIVTDQDAATEALAGVAKRATQQLADAGVDDKTFLTPKKLFAAIFKAIGFTPVQQGGGAGQFDNKIRIGFDGAGVSVAVDNTDMGRIITDEDAATQGEADEGTDDKTFLTPKKLFAAIFKAIGYTPVQQGGGAGQLDNKIRIGFDGARVKVAVDNTDMGKIITDQDVATEALAGVAKRSTQPLADAGVDDKTFLTPKKLFASIFKAIGYTPVHQGGGIGQHENKIFIGFKGPKVGLTVDESDFGNLITDQDKATQNATDAGVDDAGFVTPKKMRWGFQFIVGLNGAVVFPTWMGGFILQWGSIVLNDGTSAQVTFPVQFTTSRLATWSEVNLNISTWAGTVPGSSTSGGTNTLANMVVSYNDNGGITGVPVAWFALGK